MSIGETFLDTSDITSIGEVFRQLWNTRRLILEDPKATIYRLTEFPHPGAITNSTIQDARLTTSEDLVGRIVTVSASEVFGATRQDFVITLYNSATGVITVSTVSGGIIDAGFTDASVVTYHIDGLKYRKLPSPTSFVVLSVSSLTTEGVIESLIDRDVAYYDLKEKELTQFNNELTLQDKRFVFYDVRLFNKDIIILSEGEDVNAFDAIRSQFKYEVVKVEWNFTYNKSIAWGKSVA